jgi:uncharacterized protein YifN (PemK superfamily)
MYLNGSGGLGTHAHTSYTRYQGSRPPEMRAHAQLVVGEREPQQGKASTAEPITRLTQTPLDKFIIIFCKISFTPLTPTTDKRYAMQTDREM